MAYIITYDLLAPGQDYDKLIEKIKEFSGEKITESAWVVKTTLKASELFDSLIPFLDSNDRLFVSQLTAEAKWRTNVIGKSDTLKTLFK
ncbi:CRISPR-associated protein Cas2 [Peribacillus sp. NPDC097895]|uniref:CRISPR-associated protein Cas2 n=1 Tax=Peribacillus sp. NPDC097895 TaxID=3390619 RepID=UPI003D041D24